MSDFSSSSAIWGGSRSFTASFSGSSPAMSCWRARPPGAVTAPRLHRAPDHDQNQGGQRIGQHQPEEGPQGETCLSVQIQILVRTAKDRRLPVGGPGAAEPGQKGAAAGMDPRTALLLFQHGRHERRGAHHLCTLHLHRPGPGGGLRSAAASLFPIVRLHYYIVGAATAQPKRNPIFSIFVHLSFIKS